MQSRLLALSVLCVAAALPCRLANAAVITHDVVEQFIPGVSDGLAVPVMDRDIAATGVRNGGVGIVPQPGTPIVNDDFNYADQTAAEAGGWAFMINEPPNPPSTFTFPTPGALRMTVGRPQDFHNPGDAGQDSLMIAYRNAPISGDFIAETKLTFAEPRQFERNQGIFIGTASEFEPYLTVDGNLKYVGVGLENNDRVFTAARLYGSGSTAYPAVQVNGAHTAMSYIIRVVKRGDYYYSFFRSSESEPWIFQQWIKAPESLDGDPARPLVVGLYGKSWGGTANIQNIDFDYFRVSNISPDLTGEFTNVMDVGQPASWRTFSVWTHSMEGLKFQLRTGNTLAGGTLTDAGPFVGPDGTSATFFEEDVVNVIPNPNGKRYLEYKLVLDQTPANIPAVVLNTSADYELEPLKASFASDEDDWGAGGSGVSVQPGGGDISLTRTQVVMEDFSGTTLGSEWTFRAGDPTAPGSYNLTERPGYLRLKVGYPQDLFIGDNDIGGVAQIRSLPSGLTNYEVETEVNMEVQNNRASGILLWTSTDDFAGFTVARRNWFHYDIGVLGDVVLSNGAGLAPTVFYGSNTMQLRIAKVGNVLTMSYRDAASPSPGWHNLMVLNTAKSATGGVDFNPTHVALLSKSYGEADRGIIDVDYNYLKISSIATTGTKDFTIPLPAGNDPDALLIYGEAANPETAKFQIQGPGGAWVGPDGTAATFFTVNEPKIPDSIQGQTSATVRAQLSGTATTGVPIVKAAAIQYATDARIQRDSNASDFTGSGVGVDKSVAGLITGMVEFGAPATDEFATQPANYKASILNPAAQPSVSYPAGYVRLTMPRAVDTWGGGGIEDKPRAVVYKDQVYSGNYEVETFIQMDARQPERHAGVAIIAPNPAGTTDLNRVDITNFLMFGPYQTGEMRFLRAENNGFGDFGPLGWPGTSFYLKIRKTGNTFTGFAKVNAGDPWTEVTSTTHANLNNAYVGFLSKSWGPNNADVVNYDFDYLKVTPIVASSGTYESRVLDLGSTGLYPYVGTLGGNSGAVQIQWRAADTTAALAAAPYIGPDGTGATTYAGNATGYLPQSLFGKRYYQYRATLPVGQAINDLALVGMTVGPPSPLGQALQALRIAGGLEAATTGNVGGLDPVKGDSAGKVEMVDAVSLARTAMGL